MVGKMSSDEKKPFFPMVGIAAHSARVWSGFSLAAWSEILLLGGKTGVRRGNLCHSLIYLPGQLAFQLSYLTRPTCLVYYQGSDQFGLKEKNPLMWSIYIQIYI